MSPLEKQFPVGRSGFAISRRESGAMKLRVQVAFSCLAVIVLVLVLLFGERSGGSLDLKQERVLIKETPDQVIPVLAKALTDDSPDVRIRAAKAFYGLDPVQAQKAGALTTAFDCLQSNGPYGSRYLAAGFLKTEGRMPPGDNE
jgi:hypothetical protein